MPPTARRSSGLGCRVHEPLLAYETILAESPLNITVFDPDLVVCDASGAAAGLAGLTREAVAGRSLRDYLPAEHITACERVIAGETLELEGRISPELSPDEPWTHVLMLPILDASQTVRCGMMIVTDVTDRKHAEDLAERLACIDPLTELPNRRMVSMVLERALTGRKARRRRLALLWLNLDRFRDVNDGLGHAAGDTLLRAAGDRLREAVRTNDLVARVGDDDFLLVLPRVSSRQHLGRLIERVQAVFAKPFAVGDASVEMTASCGVALHPNAGEDPHELEDHAHTAMRAAKALGGGACQIYEAADAGTASNRLRLVGEIRDGIELGHFILHYQPQVSLATMQVQAVEALARWQHPERGLLHPAEFIGFAEETGLIVPLGVHLLWRACEHLKGWRDTLEEPPRTAINVSAREFQRTDVCGEVQRAAKAAGVPLSSLEVEITETAVLADPRHAAETAVRLREAGVSLALDDFGTGYSSLTHLRELPIDRVKVDRSFVASCLDDRSAAAILVAVTRLAHDLGMEVVAEGVETQAQLELLRAIGCDAAQGYHLARPLPHDECVEFLVSAAAERLAP